MKKLKLILLIITAILLLFAAFALYSFYPMLSMKPVETGRVFDTEIFAVKNGMNSSFLIKANDGYILFDAGSNAQKFEASLNEMEINANDIKYIFLTHSDSDHLNALALFPNAEIYMSRNELPMINKTVKRNQFGSNSLPAGIDINEITLLSDEQEITAGGVIIKCITAPGHTPGSMIYLFNEKYLFTGDAFKMNNGKFSVHPFSMDSDQSKRTILNISELAHNADIILTSHFGIRKK